MKRLAVIAAGDLGQLLAYHAVTDAGYELVGFFDDFMDPQTSTPNGLVLGPISEFEASYRSGAFDCFLVGVGYKHLAFRLECFESAKSIAPAATLVHSSCYVDPSASIGSGSVLLPGCVVDKGSSVGENTVLNTGCIIAHDSRVGDNCFLGPSVALAGFVRIDESCFLGINTTVIDNIHLATGIQTGGGAVVIDSIARPGKYVGVPAKAVA